MRSKDLYTEFVGSPATVLYNVYRAVRESDIAG